MLFEYLLQASQSLRCFNPKPFHLLIKKWYLLHIDP